MSEAERLTAWFADGTLLRPIEPGVATSVDLARALFSLVGAASIPLPGAVAELKDEIGAADHLLLILIDGLGRLQLERSPGDGFLRNGHARDLRAVFPSTTAAALTSLASAEYPARHAVPGWWVYLPDRDLSVTALPFQERFSERDLRELGLTPEELFRCPAVLPRAERRCLTLSPAAHVDGAFSRYWTGGTPVLGYTEARAAFAAALKHVQNAGAPTYTCIYLPHLDALAHEKGPDAPEIEAALSEFDRSIAEVRERLGPTGRIVVTGDHGHVPLSTDRTIVLDEDDPLLDRLRCPPSGDPTVPIFHLRDGNADRFRRLFRDRFGDRFLLLSPDELDALRLYGPEPLGHEMRQRLGDLIGLAPVPTALYYRPRGQEAEPQRGVHAGLTPPEMTVPLILG